RRYLVPCSIGRRRGRRSNRRLPRRHWHRRGRHYGQAYWGRRQIARRAKEAHHSPVLVLLPRRQCRRYPRIIALEPQVERRGRKRYLAASTDGRPLARIEEFEDLRLCPFSYQARPERIGIRRFSRTSKVD